ncbi:hypothetical protein Leryth_003698, partial [Lithospermum erythrorhizon]
VKKLKCPINKCDKAGGDFCQFITSKCTQANTTSTNEQLLVSKNAEFPIHCTFKKRHQTLIPGHSEGHSRSLGSSAQQEAPNAHIIQGRPLYEIISSDAVYKHKEMI